MTGVADERQLGISYKQVVNGGVIVSKADGTGKRCRPMDHSSLFGLHQKWLQRQGKR